MQVYPLGEIRGDYCANFVVYRVWGKSKGASYNIHAVYVMVFVTIRDTCVPTALTYRKPVAILASEPQL